MVRAHERVIVVRGPDGTLQPPVGRVQGVRMVRATGLQPGITQAVPQGGLAVDPNVAALDERGVVLVGQEPADLLGEPRRHSGRQRASRLEDAMQLGQGGGVVGHVLEHLGGDDVVERVVGEGQTAGVAVGRDADSARAAFACCLHGGEETCDVLQLGRRVVERNDARSSPERLEGVPSEPAAKVEEQVARLHAELVVADGQHECTVSVRPARDDGGTARRS